jgi:hypothetical protein
LAGGVTEVGTNPVVTPVGKPDALSVTAELNPFVLVTVIVLVPFEPWLIVTLVGEADSVNAGGCVTVSATVVVADRLPDVPVTVTV